MSTEDLERRLREIEIILEGNNTQYPNFRTRARIRQRILLQRKWDQNLLRIAATAFFVYLAMWAFLWVVRIPDPWLRALTPVVSIVLFVMMNHVVKRVWFGVQRSKATRSEGNKDEDEIDIFKA